MYRYKKIFNFFKKKIRIKKIHKDFNVEDVFLDHKFFLNENIDNEESSLSKPIKSKIQNIIFFFLIFIFLIFLFRLYILQIKDYKKYKSLADDNRYSNENILADRGIIFDRNHNKLASNSFYSSTSNNNILKREYISDVGLDNILGYISYPKIDNFGNYWRDGYNGQDGLEFMYNDLLSGINGKKIVEKNVKSKIESNNKIIKPISGADLILSIDIDLQKKLFESIKEVVNQKEYLSGTGILINVQNGEILAITSYPSYNNNLLTNPNGIEDIKKINRLLVDKSSPFLNRSVSGLFIPGSVVKPFIAYSALTEKVITPEKQILSTGALIIKNRYGGPDSVFRDWKVHGYVNVIQALAQSSDEYFYQVGGGYKDQKGLGIERIDKYADLFRLSATTGIDLPKEVKGVIPTPDWKRINFLNSEWTIGDTYHTSIGQFGFQMTPIALIRYLSIIANGGKLITPHLFLKADLSQELKLKKATTSFERFWPIQDLNLNKESLDYVRKGMRATTLSGGTVERLNFSDLKIAAKSGTAEIGIKKGRVNSLLIGYFPIDKPKYGFVFVMENGIVGITGATDVAENFLNYFRLNKEKYLD